jgi:hypothetical protein
MAFDGEDVRLGEKKRQPCLEQLSPMLSHYSRFSNIPYATYVKENAPPDLAQPDNAHAAATGMLEMATST